MSEKMCKDCEHWKITSDIVYTGVCENPDSKLFGKELLFNLRYNCVL